MKDKITFAPDFSGLDPDTGQPWSPRKVAELMGFLGQKLEPEAIRAVCEKVLTANPDKVKAYQAGKHNMLGFFIKLVLDETAKKADPKVASEVLKELLSLPNVG